MIVPHALPSLPTRLPALDSPAPRRGTRPLHFGAAGSPLYGVFHEPASGGDASTAVVLCPPGPQQYMYTHWAYRQLAARLAEAGLPVLRFDYYGVGDSSGGIADGTLERWVDDVAEARAAARELAGAARTSLVGYGLGAVIAWRATAADEDRVRDLVLWEPVVRGRAYLGALAEAEARFAMRLLHFPDYGSPPRDLGGYPVPPAQRQATEAVDLLTEPPPRATRVTVVVGEGRADAAPLAERLEREVRRAACVHVPGERPQHDDDQLLAPRAVRAIVRVLAPETAA